MRLQIRHQTRYEYTTPVSQSVNQLCLMPRSCDHQKLISVEVVIEPEPLVVDRGRDHFGNSVARFGIDEPHRQCTITVKSVVDTRDELLPQPDSSGIDENRRRLREDRNPAALMAHDCLLPSPYVKRDTSMDALLNECSPQGQSVLGYADVLMKHIFTTFSYDSKFSSLVTPISEVLAARRGVCQDFAHLAIATLRRAGIPAGYVSGYLETLPPPGQQKLRGADASHAWFSVYDVDSGWHGFDPTNGKRPDRQYVVTANGRDYGDVTPLKGIVYGGGKHRLHVEVDVDRALTSVN